MTPRTLAGHRVFATVSPVIHRKIESDIGPGKRFHSWSHAVEYALANLHETYRKDAQMEQLKLEVATLQGVVAELRRSRS